MFGAVDRQSRDDVAWDAYRTAASSSIVLLPVSWRER
jgi:hypothetical protein